MPGSYLPSADDALAVWGANASTKITATPVPLGVTAAIATQLATSFAAFQTALTAARDPSTRGPARTLAKQQAKRAFVDYVRMVVRQIQGTSTVTDAQRQSLGITVPKQVYQPSPPPGTPYKITATLDATGALKLVWKCQNPKGTSGTMYQVYRKLGAAGDNVYLGGAGMKSLTDETIPAGTHVVTYGVQAIRSTSVGAWAYHTVNFAVGGQVVPQALKLAA